MYLAKSCKKAHNIKTSNTLMLGSLYYYRATENLEIRDEAEGTSTYNLKINGPLQIEREWLGGILEGQVKQGKEDYDPGLPGQTDVYIEEYKWLPSPAEHINVEKLHATIKRQCFNSFIFCMSAVESPEDAESIFEGYEDYWIIPEEKAEDLGRAIVDALYFAISKGRVDGRHIIDPKVPLDSLICYCQHMRVAYVDRDVTINHHSEVTAEEFLRRLENIAYLKPRKFSHESEYRFAFTLAIDDSIVPIHCDHLLLDSSRIRKVL
ncbi:hypothetical protein ACK1VC_25635 [Pseudomonas sp. XP2]